MDQFKFKILLVLALVWFDLSQACPPEIPDIPDLPTAIKICAICKPTGKRSIDPVTMFDRSPRTPQALEVSDSAKDCLLKVAAADSSVLEKVTK